MTVVTASSIVKPRFGFSIGSATLSLLAALILLAAAVFGTPLHRATWDATEPIRFHGDIVNAYQRGQQSASTGLARHYDAVAKTARPRPDGQLQYGLDYPPLRLAVAHYWHGWTQERFPGVTAWQNTAEFNAPLLTMNQIFLAIAALSVFALVHMARRWRAATVSGNLPSGGTGLVPGALAAAIVWVSPPAVLIGFGWPQWDIAVAAFFLAALYASCRNAWLLAGMLLATGAMYKGQVLAGLPVLLIWPVVAGRWSALPRFGVGFVLAVGMIAAPFAMPGQDSPVRPEVIWFAVAMLAAWLLGCARRQVPQVPWKWWLVPVLLLLGLCAAAGLVAAWYWGAVLGGVVGLCIFVMAGRLPWGQQFLLPAIGVAMAIWAAAIVSGASWNWLRVGLLYGADHYNSMTMGSPSNFAAILPQFRVARPDIVAFTLPEWLVEGGYEITWRVFLRGIYVAGSVLCGIAMGVHFRRRNPLFLLAATTTWLLFVTFPAQIHERYVLYPALVSATFIALGFGWTFMHIAIALIAVLPALHGMLAGGNHAVFLSRYMGLGFGTELLRNVQATHPGIGWALVTITLVCLWKTMDLRRPRVNGLPSESSTRP